MLDEKLKKDLEKAIESALPAQIGIALTKELDRLKQLEKENDALNKAMKDQSAKIDSMALEIERYKRDTQTMTQLKKREEEVAERERDISIKELHYQLESEKSNRDFARDIALGLVRNTVYKKHVFDSENGPMGKDQYGSPIYGNTTKSYNSEEKAE